VSELVVDQPGLDGSVPVVRTTIANCAACGWVNESSESMAARPVQQALDLEAGDA
jgi:hypothetical protein